MGFSLVLEFQLKEQLLGRDFYDHKQKIDWVFTSLVGVNCQALQASLLGNSMTKTTTTTQTKTLSLTTTKTNKHEEK